MKKKKNSRVTIHELEFVHDYLIARADEWDQPEAKLLGPSVTFRKVAAFLNIRAEMLRRLQLNRKKP